MAVYRISDKGLQQMVSRAAWQALPFSGAILLVAILIGGFNIGWSTIAEIWYVYLIVGIAVVFLSRNRRQSAMRKAGEALCVVLDDDTLSVDSGPIHVSIGRHEVTAIRETKAGIYVRGQSFKTTVLLLKELENYEELRERLNAWAPADVARAPGRHIFGLMIWVPVLVMLVLLVSAFTVTNPVVGPVLCLATAITLVGCLVFIVRSEYADARTKKMMFAVLFPVLGLLQRAHYLWTGSNFER